MKLLREISMWDQVFDDVYASPTRLFHQLRQEQDTVRRMITAVASSMRHEQVVERSAQRSDQASS